MSIHSRLEITTQHSQRQTAGYFSSFLIPSDERTEKKAHSRLEQYFHPELQEEYQKLSLQVRSCVQVLLVSSTFLDDAEYIRQLIFLRNRAPENWKDHSDHVLSRLTEKTARGATHFQTINRIYERKWEDIFFQCSCTRQRNFYSLEELVEIIALFDTVLSVVDPTYPPPEKCPYYNEGGKEFLKEIQNNPSLLQEQPQQNDVELPFTVCRKNSFKELKSCATQYIGSLQDSKKTIFYIKAVRRIENSTFSDPTKKALIQLLVLATKRGSSIADWEEIVDGAACVEQKWGEEVLESLHTVFSSLSDSIHIFHLLNLLKDDGNVIETIRQFEREALSFSDLVQELEKYLPPPIDIVAEGDIEQVLTKFSGNDLHVKFPLPREHLHTIGRQYLVVQRHCQEWKALSLGQLTHLASMLSSRAVQSTLAEEEILQLIAIGRLALYIKSNRYAYVSQILTLLGLLCHKQGSIAQVKTGEGKSMIVVLLAFIHAIQKKNLHIISSSKNLAMRDREEYSSFFTVFGITTDHICDPQPSANRFISDILYGTASDFEFAIMREMLHATPLFPQKKGGCSVIIDELDNLTIDTAQNGARLSMPAEENFEWVYKPLLSFVQSHFTKENSTIHEESITHLKKLLMNRAPKEASEISLPDEQLYTWLRAAISALFILEENKDYIVRDKKILIVDAKNTGRLMHGMRWSQGTHEFVEVKHGIDPSKESLTPLSISHAVFYPMYQSIFGLTGTAGSQNEREEIREIYGITCFDVPTHRPCLREDRAPQLFSSNEQHIATIVEKIQTSHNHRRPILLLCETIQDSLSMEKHLLETGIIPEMLNEIQKRDEKDILDRAGECDAVTIATNTAGRGTDIKLERLSREQGGLHVIITFFPTSQRVEWQARGRAGRQGEPGLSEVLIPPEKGISNSDETIPALERKRTLYTALMKRTHTGFAEMERYVFSFAQDFFSSIGRFQKSVSTGTSLKKCAFALSSCRIDHRRAKKQKIQEQQLIQQAFDLLTGTDIQPIQWQVFLTQLATRLQQKAIVAWSTHVYKEMEELMRSTQLEAYARIQENLQETASHVEEKKTAQFFHFLEQQMNEARAAEISCFKQKVAALYAREKETLVQYLDPSGSGLIQYLRERTNSRLEIG